MCEKIICSRLEQIAEHAKSKGIPALKACAEECIEKRGGHSFANLSMMGGGVKADYCLYCLTYRVNDATVFDPRNAKSPPSV
jgi:hypothetical protein